MVRLSLLVPAVLAALALQLALEFAPASADPADAAATSAYLSANYAFVRSADAATKRVESTLHALPGRVAHECGNAAAGSPEDTDSEQLSNELIGIIKASALAAIVTLLDLMGQTRFIFARTFDFSVYLYCALIYLAMTEGIRRVVVRIERGLSRHKVVEVREVATAPAAPRRIPIGGRKRA